MTPNLTFQLITCGLGTKGTWAGQCLTSKTAKDPGISKRKYLGGVLEAWKLWFLCLIVVLRQTLSDWE